MHQKKRLLLAERLGAEGVWESFDFAIDIKSEIRDLNCVIDTICEDDKPLYQRTLNYVIQNKTDMILFDELAQQNLHDSSQSF